MPSHPLTVKAIKAARVPDGERDIHLWDAPGPRGDGVMGLCLVCTKTGLRTFKIKARDKYGRQRWHSLGRFGELTIDQAREKAREALPRLRNGEDLKAERDQAKRVPTVSEAGAEWLEYLPTRSETVAAKGGGKRKAKPPGASTLRLYRSCLKNHVTPALGRMPLPAVTELDIDRLHSKVGVDSPTMANRTLTTLSQIYAWAIKKGYCRENPTAGVARYPEVKRGSEEHPVVLDRQMMGRLFEAMEEEEKVSPHAVAAMRVLFWSGWRKSEVLGLGWERVDLETGIVTLATTKTGGQVRALPNEALEVLRKLRKDNPFGQWCFPSPKKHGSHLEDIRRPWERVRDAAGLHLGVLGSFRLHDLRHSNVSYKIMAGKSLKEAGASVGHASTQATERYSHLLQGHLKDVADAGAERMKKELGQE